jgi:hypothetical protein
MSVYSNHHPEAISGVPPDPYDVAEPVDRDPSVPAGEPVPDWPDDDPQWEQRWGLTFEDDVPQLNLRDFVVTATDLKALKAPPPDADVVLVPVEGGAA